MKCSVELLEAGALLREIQAESSSFGSVLPKWEMAYCFTLLLLHFYRCLQCLNTKKYPIRSFQRPWRWYLLEKSLPEFFQSHSLHQNLCFSWPGLRLPKTWEVISDQNPFPFSPSEGQRWRLFPLMSILSYQKIAHGWLFLAVLWVVVLLEMRKGARSTLRKVKRSLSNPDLLSQAHICQKFTLSS